MLETSGTRTYLRLVRPTAAGFSPLDYVQSPPLKRRQPGRATHWRLLMRLLNEHEENYPSAWEQTGSTIPFNDVIFNYKPRKKMPHVAIS